MLALQKQLLGYSTDLMNGTGPAALGGLNTINQGYAQMPDKITAQLAGRGFGASGKLGTALYDTENARLNNQSNFRAQTAQQGAGLGESLLNSGRGTMTTGPSSMAANGFLSAGNGLSNLSTLLMLHKVLGGGNNGNGPSNGFGLGYPEQGVQTSNLPTNGSTGDWGGEY